MLKLYSHPFSSYSQKVLIALYENDTLFEYRNLEEPSANAELAALWPLKRFPVVVDGDDTIFEATTIIEYLQIHHPGRARLIPDGDAGVEARMLDRVFDNYVMTPMQKIVGNQLRAEPIATLTACSRHAGCSTRSTHGSTSGSPDELGLRREFHIGRLRRRSVSLLRRLGARDSGRVRESQGVPRAALGSPIRCACGGRGATLSPLLSTRRAESRLNVSRHVERSGVAMNEGRVSERGGAGLKRVARSLVERALHGVGRLGWHAFREVRVTLSRVGEE